MEIPQRCEAAMESFANKQTLRTRRLERRWSSQNYLWFVRRHAKSRRSLVSNNETLEKKILPLQSKCELLFNLQVILICIRLSKIFFQTFEQFNMIPMTGFLLEIPPNLEGKWKLKADMTFNDFPGMKKERECIEFSFEIMEF